MLFATIYTARGDVTEEKEKRGLQLFTKWTPPAGFDIKAHYTLADGSGGIVIAEVSSAAVALEATLPWGPFLEFKTVPVVEVGEAVPISHRIYAWRDSVR